MMSHTWYGGGMHQGFQTMQTVPRGHSMPPSPQLTSLPPLYPSANIPSMHMSQHIQHAPYQQHSLASSMTMTRVPSRPSSLVMLNDGLIMASPRELNPSRFPSRDINLMTPSTGTVVTPIQASPARPASVRAAMQKYTCDFQCGFMGGYEEVSLHERICDRGVKPTTIQSTPQPQARTPSTPINAMSFNCDFGCGFVGTFKQVEDHERNCKNAPQATQLSSVVDLNERRYQCDFGCNFEGSFQAVEMHEKACDKRPGAQKKPAPSLATQASKQTPSALFPGESSVRQAPPANQASAKKNAAPPAAAGPKASPPAPGLEQQVFYCHHMCGFKGNFEQVDWHEKSCTTTEIADV